MPVCSRSPRVLTGEECRLIIERFGGTFSRHGIDITQHPLGEDLTEVGWLASIRGDVFADGSPTWQDRPRAAQSLRKVLLAERRSRALDTCSGLPGFQHVIKHLKNLRTDGAYSASQGTDDASDQAWDRIYEVEIAARLAHLPMSISFPLPEPDVLVTDSSSESVAFACKRPRKPGTVERALLTGFDQLQSHEAMGFVAINADLLLNPIATGAEPLVPECQQRLEQIGEVCAEARRRLDDQPHPTPEARRGVLGVIVTATFGLSGVDRSSGASYVNTRFLVDTWPHPRLESLAAMPAMFRDFLLAGEASLIGAPNDGRSP